MRATPLVVGAVGLGVGVAAIAIALAHRPKPPPVDAPLPASVPRGFRRLRNNELTPALIREAKRILASALHIGSVSPFTLDGQEYAGLLEWHMNGKPHRGVSMLVRT